MTTTQEAGGTTTKKRDGGLDGVWPHRKSHPATQTSSSIKRAWAMGTKASSAEWTRPPDKANGSLW